MLEITGQEISALSDSDLRSLVGLLCEAELRMSGLPTAGVTWGGHQNAKDGGLDVRVSLTSTLHPDGFIPRSSTGFQVKKPDMPRSDILKEMRPDDELRQVIKDLAKANGAYIIVSSSGSTSDSALSNRKKAMREALSDLEDASTLKTEFYDRGRLAGWVRSHPALVLWVREKLGNPIQGWRPYENWAKAPGGVEEEYLLDDEIRLHNGTALQADGMTATEGINCLRTVLRCPRSSVRLVGLSGVGKTRLLQALFDERIGTNALNPSQVFYCDIGDRPNPAPPHFAERLLALHKPGILAIDNCPPDLHRRLTDVCATPESLVSLITVEYDIREDQPEETAVFRLEPASVDLVEKIIQGRFSHVGQVNLRTIAEFSGGNARIAIALANTIKRGETLADLKDEELFKRLFLQRNEFDPVLLKSAEVCSLVCSFDCQTTAGSDQELRLLGSLADRSVKELFAAAAELKGRDLVQERGIWRAVLPQALANRLARRALEKIPIDDVLEVFMNGGSERLFISFSRRLGYLHECERAVDIADKWLSTGDLLGDVSNLNALGLSLLRNIAPLKPEATLAAIERAANGENGENFSSRANGHHIEFTRLLRSLAYDKELFERSVDLICRFALSEDPNENHNSTRDLLKSLFPIQLSGTHASAEQRLGVIKNLIDANSEEKQELGLLLLGAALETGPFSPHYGFDFGARTRDYGYSPKTREDFHEWFGLFVNYTAQLAVSEKPIAPRVKTLLAEKFRGLWMRTPTWNELEAASELIISKGPWNEGWVAVRTTLRFDAKDMEANVLSRLQKLKELLAPRSLLEQARIYALSSHGSVLDLVDAEDHNGEGVSDSYSKVESAARVIGQKVACDEKVFKALLPDILSRNGVLSYSFAQGLGDGCPDALGMWKEFRQHLVGIDPKKHNYKVLCGFLHAISVKSPELSEAILTEAVTDEVLAPAFPILQTSVEINSQGIERLKQSLENAAAPIQIYQNLAYGRVHESIGDEDFCDLLRLIASKPSGLAVAIEILGLRFYSSMKTEKVATDTMKSVGQELLSMISFDCENNHLYNGTDYDLGKIIEACLADEEAKASAEILCENLAQAFSEDKASPMNYRHVLEALAATQPIAFLDGFLGDAELREHLIMRLFLQDMDHSPHPLSKIPDTIILDWCSANPAVRYPIIAACIIPYRNIEQERQLEWTPLALTIITEAPDPVVILNELKRSVTLMSWNGSQTECLQKCLSLISDLKSHSNPSVAEWAEKEENVLEDKIRSKRHKETQWEQTRNERFE